MSMRLFIVDDEAPARVRLKTLLSDIAQECPHQLVGEADNAQDALDGIVETRPDIVLMDVQMPGMSGIELASHLAQCVAEAPGVIFVTAYDEYALKAFDVHALDYLLKPVRASRLALALQRGITSPAHHVPRQEAIAATAAAMHSKRQYFSVQERGRLLLVPITDVLYLKAELKYVTLRTKARDYLIEESLVSIENEMAAIFVRIHRNALVARNAIIGVERAQSGTDIDGDESKIHDIWQVLIREVEERLPISRRQWSVIKALVK